jgi:hypothetical protein
VSQLDRSAVALRNDGICCPRSPRFPTKTEKLKLCTCCTATASVNPYFALLLPTSHHFSPHHRLATILVKENRALSSIFFEELLPKISNGGSATGCALFHCDSRGVVACFRFLFVARAFALHRFAASLNSAFCRSVSVLFLLCSTNAKESYPWNGPHLSTKKSI